MLPLDISYRLDALKNKLPEEISLSYSLSYSKYNGHRLLLAATDVVNEPESRISMSAELTRNDSEIFLKTIYDLLDKFEEKVLSVFHT